MSEIKLREIAHRTTGKSHGPITNLINPRDIGELTKPFIFLDYVNAPKGPGFGFHPHSGIATLTHPLTFDLEHSASSGQVDIVKKGGIEWVIAGKGIWHKARILNEMPAQGFQLWFSLPPSLEGADPKTQFITPEQVPNIGPVRVLLGQYKESKSPIDSPFEATLLFVQLKAGSTWEYAPSQNHLIAWAFLQKGELTVNGENVKEELIVFEEGNGLLKFQAINNCALLFGSAKKHEYPLVIGPHSIHTNIHSLGKSQQRIVEIGDQLKREGKL